MNKGDLINALSAETGSTKADAEKFLNALQHVFIKSLKKGDKISLTGFLSVESSKRKATTGRNPRTGAAINIPAKNVVKIKAGKLLADSVN